MKNLFKVSLVSILLLSSLFSCDKEENNRPEISDVEVENHDGAADVKLGGTISVNFSALAGETARLDFYHIEIHDHPTSGSVHDEYKIIDSDFKDKSTFKGLRNATVHEHVQVPDSANLGSYHVVITVVDEEGYSVNTEDLETHITFVE
ncbi:MAG: DUF4625 domain-containing protein [Bacteroidales bacterium]|nr:DUF4625 domain-containing protein [Bacteroidales bacterium]